MSFSYKNGWLYCDSLRVKDIQNKVLNSPFYLYSSIQIRSNYQQYRNALKGIDSKISFAFKANGNLTILKILRDIGSWATLVSGNELQLALNAGFQPNQMIFNGNGKTIPELRLAVKMGTLVNIDSHFDLNHINEVSKVLGKQTNVLLRINPGIDPYVHPYIATGQSHSKFGVSTEEVTYVLSQISKMRSLKLVGLHCHLGSTIDDMRVFRKTMVLMSKLYHQIQEQGFRIQILNLGGGLGIDYKHTRGSYPNPSNLVDSIRELIPPNATLILEPGRSIVGNAGILVCKVIGVKTSEKTNFIVIDGSMTELIRPSLYQAYHKIDYIEPVTGIPILFDIVGPVCESTDFLGINRSLARPDEGIGIAIFDTGAYGYAMSSNYNARNRPAEYLVEGDSLSLIRRGENFQDQLHIYD